MGKDGILTPLLKELLEGALDGEPEAHIDEEQATNRKYGKGRKQVKTAIEAVKINTPRDRNGTLESELVPKQHKNLGMDLDRQIIVLYTRGASYSDIRDHLMDMYGLEASTTTISCVTDKISPLIQEWHCRHLERVTPLYGWTPSTR